MNNDPSGWTLASLLLALFGGVYNWASGIDAGTWLGIGSFSGMVLSLLMQFYYHRRRDAREHAEHLREEERMALEKRVLLARIAKEQE